MTTKTLDFTWGKVLAGGRHPRVWVLCGYMMNQDMPPLDWLPGRTLVTISKLQGAIIYHTSYHKICERPYFPLPKFLRTSSGRSINPSYPNLTSVSIP